LVIVGKEFKRNQVTSCRLCKNIPISFHFCNALFYSFIFDHRVFYLLDLVLGYAMIYNHRNNNSLTVQAQLSPSPRVGLPAPSNNINDFFFFFQIFLVAVQLL
jgi:hypothetical protein